MHGVRKSAESNILKIFNIGKITSII